MLHARKRIIASNPPGNDAVLTNAHHRRSSVGQFISRRYQTLRNKLIRSLSSGSDASSQVPTQSSVERVRPTGPGFWSPTSNLGDEEQRYQEVFLPAMDVRTRLAPGTSAQSMSDGSETIRGIWMRSSNSISPTSRNSLLVSPLQRPLSIYDCERKLVFLSWSLWCCKSSLHIRIFHWGQMQMYAVSQLLHFCRSDVCSLVFAQCFLVVHERVPFFDVQFHAEILSFQLQHNSRFCVFLSHLCIVAPVVWVWAYPSHCLSHCQHFHPRPFFY